jgi:hypothetical protein
MHPGDGLGLPAGPGIIVPAVIEQDKHRLELVAVGHVQVALDPILKAALVLLPEQVMQGNAQRVESQVRSPAQPSSRSIVTGSKVSTCHISN